MIWNRMRNISLISDIGILSRLQYGPGLNKFFEWTPKAFANVILQNLTRKLVLIMYVYSVRETFRLAITALVYIRSMVWYPASLLPLWMTWVIVLCLLELKLPCLTMLFFHSSLRYQHWCPKILYKYDFWLTFLVAILSWIVGKVCPYNSAYFGNVKISEK